MTYEHVGRIILKRELGRCIILPRYVTCRGCRHVMLLQDLIDRRQHALISITRLHVHICQKSS
jgi:hypothetical protein